MWGAKESDRRLNLGLSLKIKVSVTGRASYYDSRMIETYEARVLPMYCRLHSE